ncbi:MAG: class IIb bacteriocin, lactobin A/cerein 7B family [Bacteroidota bacterium]
MNLNEKEYGLVPLSEKEMTETNGGILPIILLAGEIYAGICLLSYAAGYTAGTIKKNL